MIRHSFLSLGVAFFSMGCAVGTEPEPQPETASVAPEARPVQAGVDSREERAAPTPEPTFCTIPRTPPVLGEGSCEQKIVIVSLTASACFQGRVTGTLRYACNGGPAIVELGTRILYGTYGGGRISVCGSDRFVLDERKACSDGPELFSGLVGMEGSLDGPLSVRWEAVPLSRDPACTFTTCKGAGSARVETIEP